MSFIFALEDAMASVGFNIIGSIDFTNPNFQRFKHQDAPTKGKNLFVKLLNGGAIFGDWRNEDSWVTWWEKSYKQVSVAERREREIEKEIQDAATRARQNHAKARTALLWQHRAAHEASRDHHYVNAKRIIPFGALQIRSTLMLKVEDINGQIQTLQFIKQNGFKKFKKGAPTKGGMIWLNGGLSSDYDGVIRVCEGWATGCTIADVTKSPVVCSLNAYNLVPVAIALRKKYINANIKICADNDCWGKENVGLKYAREASAYTGCAIHYPDFRGLDVSGKPTDFNDLFMLSGLAAFENVKRQLILIRK